MVTEKERIVLYHYPYMNPNWGHHTSPFYHTRSPIQVYPPQFYYEGLQPMTERIHSNQDHGPNPYVVDIEKATKRNRNFRTAIWTGRHLQVTVMSLNVGEDIGLEVHRNTDQFIRIEEGQGLVQIGDSRHQLTFTRRVSDDDAIMIPAGKWHNVINTGNKPLKLYSIYAPPEHPHGTVHPTKKEALAAEAHYHR